MFSWFNRRKKIRRDSDVRAELERVIDAKHKASIEALAKLRQFTLERRDGEPPLSIDRRRERTA